jgi:squalene cyclase
LREKGIRIYFERRERKGEKRENERTNKREKRGKIQY